VCTEAHGLNEVERLGAAVVRAVDDGANGQTESQAEFCAGGTACMKIGPNPPSRWKAKRSMVGWDAN
jgi:hypothetical protein